jgi:hypothetical protein
LLFVVVKLVFQRTKQRFEANKVNFKVLFSTMAQLAPLWLEISNLRQRGPKIFFYLWERYKFN